jgi:signal transduction histidine kinase
MTFTRAPNAVARRDLAWLCVAMIIAAAVSIHFELSETLLAWTRPWERYQLDELPGMLLFLALGLAWFAWRRMCEARIALAQRINLERDLAAALTENRRLSQSIVQMQEEERRSLAREMHDELGQHLNAIKIDAVTIRDGTGDAPVRASAETIIRVVDRVHGVVRDITRKLRPAGLDELGLPAALENCVEEWRGRSRGVAVELSCDGDLEGLGEATNMLVYRIVQESLTNVARHAQASKVTLRIARAVAPAADALVIEVVDDGHGAVARTVDAKHGGLGLIGMRERVDAAGGRLETGSAASGGFRVCARVPVSL